MRPFEGIRVIDATHALAGPFAAYQLAVLGADVIKVEHPDEPDQSRSSGTEPALNQRQMGTGFLTHASNKRSSALDLKGEKGREAIRRLESDKAAADPQRAARGVTCRHQGATGVDSGFGVPLAAFTFAHAGPRIDTPPTALGEHTDAVLAQIGYRPAGIARLRAAKVI